MSGVYSDVISGWYHNQNGRHGLPSTCNRKGYKTPFVDLVTIIGFGNGV